ncbi:DUF3158 family protein [Pseudomonas sp. P1B16]|uniref:DUF3158 family protein n=2 Tax=Pseudomonas TaxID=286 RepID=A0A6G6ISW0_PSENT|nr:MULTISPECIES: DUF3158 family protein [Pseudomonas]KYO76851.1 hypothetical protein LT18_04938 [Pseudomonas aeruginosa]NWD82486.1 DUF3158 family protein [Pseudomonas reactans]NWE91166.1 DUF3158 family protein [Pseudomonas reactans]QIE86082.1 DUF3158 family protein [Pseudomonas nitroreducens]WPM29212.1 DUF3158 family protein [Pseudomonas sp. P1B16]
MTTTSASAAARRFHPLEQADFQRLEQAAYLKGLLRPFPFKGKGTLTEWASQCHALRDDLIELAQRRVLAQAIDYPFRLLPVELAQQTTGAGTVFLRWRRPDRSAMGVALWQALITSPATPNTLIDDLYAMEVQRIVLNMQISLLHTLGRQAHECACKVAQAESTYLQRVPGNAASIRTTSSKESL